MERRAGEGGGPRERAADRVGQGRGLANTQTEVDVATFTQWVERLRAEADGAGGFYFKRFRKEFRPAVDAWVATRPLKNPNAPLTPFAMPQYKLAARARVRPARRTSGASTPAQARRRHPARVELRARCRPLRLGAVLRGHEHQAELTEAARRDALDRLRRLPRSPPLDRDLAGQRDRLSASRAPPKSGSPAVVLIEGERPAHFIVWPH